MRTICGSQFPYIIINEVISGIRAVLTARLISIWIQAKVTTDLRLESKKDVPKLG